MSVEFEKIVLEKLTNLENNFTYLTSRVDNLSEELHETKEKVNNNTNLINSLSEKVDTQGLNFAKFEHEFNMKVQALFDSFVANTESHLSYEKSIATLNAKTFHHDARISVLEDKNKNSAIFAHN